MNESMVNHSVSIFVKALVKKSVNLSTARILVCGYTFKENCPDTRNTKVRDLVSELINFGLEVDIYDPIAEEKVENLKPLSELKKKYDGIILAVPHECFIEKGEFKFIDKLNKDSVLFDLKAALDKDKSDIRL